MARLSDEMQKVARDKMSRAAKRLNGAATAVARKDVTEGEFDNHFDGVVSAIFHTGEDPPGDPMSGKREKIDIRRQVVHAADESNVQTNDYERAIILGQFASLLATHPRIAGKIAFKGGGSLASVSNNWYCD